MDIVNRCDQIMMPKIVIRGRWTDKQQIIASTIAQSQIMGLFSSKHPTTTKLKREPMPAHTKITVDQRHYREFQKADEKKIITQFRTLLNQIDQQHKMKRMKLRESSSVVPGPMVKKKSVSEDNIVVESQQREEGEQYFEKLEAQQMIFQEKNSGQMKISEIKVKKQQGELSKVSIIIEEESESTSTNLQCIDELIHRAEMSKKYEKTLLELENLFKEFAIEGKVTSQAFQELVQTYREKDQIISSRFMPWIIKIQQKIYSRLTTQINEMLSKKIQFPNELINLENQQIDLVSKIEVMSEQLKLKIQKIQELEHEMFYQRQIVKISNKKKLQAEFDSQQYEAKLEEVYKDRERIKQKVNKYKSKLVAYRKNKNSTNFMAHDESSEMSNDISSQNLVSRQISDQEVKEQIVNKQKVVQTEKQQNQTSKQESKNQIFRRPPPSDEN